VLRHQRPVAAASLRDAANASLATSQRTGRALPLAVTSAGSTDPDTNGTLAAYAWRVTYLGAAGLAPCSPDARPVPSTPVETAALERAALEPSPLAAADDTAAASLAGALTASPDAYIAAPLAPGAYRVSLVVAAGLGAGLSRSTPRPPPSRALRRRAGRNAAQAQGAH
jgi:hypothetical protein